MMVRDGSRRRSRYGLDGCRSARRHGAFARIPYSHPVHGQAVLEP